MMRQRYNRRQPKVRDIVRIVAEIPRETIENVDNWAAPAGLPSRTAALDMLLRRGLQAVQSEGQQAG